MKACTVPELDNLVTSLKPLVGARLQEVRTSDRDVVLGFYSAGQLLWLWADLSPVRPSILPWSELPQPITGRRTPVQLFLRAHFSGRVLLDVRRDERLGRVVNLMFSDYDRIEIRLVPHAANFLAWAGGKSISLEKPLELAEAPSPDRGTKRRGLEELREEWRAVRSSRSGRARSRAVDPVERLRSELERKRKALVKVDQELQRKRDLPWRELGLWLKREQSLEVPDPWVPFVDKRRKLSWNIEQAFTKAREAEGKIFGTEQRRRLLTEEILRLERELEKPRAEIEAARPKVELRPLEDSHAEGRTLRINEELVAVAGKNAADNLKILRKARAWDFWLHLQDRPGAHVILFRNKSTSVSEAVLRQVINWFVRLQLGAKHGAHVGEKFEVVVAECRHVRPIKGDKLGRVHYQNERILIHRIS